MIIDHHRYQKASNYPICNDLIISPAHHASFPLHDQPQKSCMIMKLRESDKADNTETPPFL